MGLGGWLKGVGESVLHAGNLLKGDHQTIADLVANEAATNEHFGEGGTTGNILTGLKLGAQSTLGAGANVVAAASPDALHLGDAVNWVGEQVPRPFETLAITAQHSKAMGDEQGWVHQFGSLFDRSAWAQAWDLSKSDPGLGAATWTNIIFSDDQRVLSADPLNAKQADIIQKEANSTWYGSMTNGAIYFLEGMAVPGGGIAKGALKGAREARTINTAGQADRAFEAGQKLVKEGKLDKARPQKVRDAFRNATGGEASGESLVGRSVRMLDSVWDAQDQAAIADRIAPLMENASDMQKFAVANTLHSIKQTVPVADRTEAGMNALFAAAGSAPARARLAETHPLVAADLTTRTGAPRVYAALEDLRTARLDKDETTVDSIIEKHWNTAADKAEIAALKERVASSAAAAEEMRTLHRAAVAGKPLRKNFDADILKETRGKAAAEHKAARQELVAANDELRKAKRGARKAGPETRSLYEERLGQARMRVEQAKQRADSAKADRDLYESTPLPGGHVDFDEWRQSVADARQARGDAEWTTRWDQAELNTAKRNYAEKQAEIKASLPSLTMADARLSDILNLGGHASGAADEAVGAAIHLTPSLLDKAKVWARHYEGEEGYLRLGDGNKVARVLSVPFRPAVRKAAKFGAPMMRNHIALNEVDLGRRQLADALRRSKAFDPQEIRAAQNEFMSAPAGAAYEGGLSRGLVVDKWQHEVVKRIAQRHGMTEEQAIKETASALKAFGQGRAHLLRQLDEQATEDLIHIVDPETGNVTLYNGPLLRSHLQDNATFLSPEDFEKALKKRDKERPAAARAWSAAWDFNSNVNDSIVTLWKHGMLLRPGLATRALLDTQVRSIAMIGAAATMVNSINGAGRLLQRAERGGLTAVQRLVMRGETPVSLGKKMTPTIDTAQHTFKAGNKKFRAAFNKDRAEREAAIMAMTKGGSYRESLMHSTTDHLRQLEFDRSSWRHYAADAPEWTSVYAEYANLMAHSPTVKRLMTDTFEGSADDLIEHLRKDPAIREEYQQFGRPKGMEFGQYVQRLVAETRQMFPEREIFETARNGKMSKKMVDRVFPPDERFELLGPEATLRKGGGLMGQLKKVADLFYANALDKPDMWLVRNPTAVTSWRRYLQNEIRSELRGKGDDFEMSAERFEALSQRAKNRAIAEVRRSMYDTTRFTHAHNVITKISPFFAPYEDAMMSWARLLYDDPSRAVKLAGAWTGPERFAQGYTGGVDINNLDPDAWYPVVDEDGNPVTADTPPGDRFIVLPHIPGLPGVKYRIRKDALNSIAQGGVPWLPGFGPVQQVATTVLLADVLPHDAALAVVNSDNDAVQTFLESMFLGGEAPKGDPQSIGAQLVPSWARAMLGGTSDDFKDTFGNEYARTVQYAFNAQIAEAQKNGEPINKQKFFERAKKQASAGAWVRTAATGLFGLSGSAAVDGQFYVDRYNELRAMDKATLKKEFGVDSYEKAFTKLWPEAADLDWSVTSNETGVQPTVKAQVRGTKLRSLIDQNKDYGWFIVGSDNVGGEFSRTAYNQQVQDRWRTSSSAEDVVKDSMVSQGWADYDKYQLQINQKLKAAGLEDDSKLRSELKGAVREWMAQNNPDWWEAYSNPQHTTERFLADGWRIANSPKVKNREDMVLFRDYVTARKEVMEKLGIKGLSGMGQKYQVARSILRDLGDKAASENLGFQQAWDRMLSREVEEPHKEEMNG